MPTDEETTVLRNRITALQERRKVLAAQDADICIQLDKLVKQIGWSAPPSTTLR